MKAPVWAAATAPINVSACWVVQRSPLGRQGSRVPVRRTGSEILHGYSELGIESRAREGGRAPARCRNGVPAVRGSAVRDAGRGRHLEPALDVAGRRPGWRHRVARAPSQGRSAGLERFATAVSDPRSPQYGQYDSIADLARALRRPGGRARAGRQLPPARRRHRRQDRCHRTVRRRHVDGVRRPAGCSAPRWANFRTAARGAALHGAESGERGFPPALRGDVTGVVGLDTQPLLGSSHADLSQRCRVAAHGARRPGLTTATTSRATCSGPATAAGCSAAISQSGFTPNQYLTAYNYAPLQSSGLEGQGERVALIEIDGFRYSDLRTSPSASAWPRRPSTATASGSRSRWRPAGESTLDLEVLDAAAPKLKAVDVYESQPNAVDVLQSLTAPLTNTGSKPDVISASLGSCEHATVADDRQLRAARRRGIAGPGRRPAASRCWRPAATTARRPA